MIVKRGSSYGVRVYQDGRRKWVGTFKTRREARDGELEALRRPTSPREETCDSFAARWVVDYPRPAAATRRTHTYALRAFIRDFAGVRLSDVDRPIARAWALGQPKGNVYVVRAMSRSKVWTPLRSTGTRRSGRQDRQSRWRSN